MASNPLYARLVRDHPMPRLPGPIGVALITALVSLILWQIEGVTSVAQLQRLMLVPLGVLLMAPILTAGYAAALTASYANTSEYALLRISPISPEEIVWGYFLAALYRLQILLAIAVGLIPLAYGVFQNERLVRLWLGSSPLSYLALLIGLLADNITAAAIGVALGLRLRRPVDATLIAVIIFAVLPVLFVIAHPVVTGPPSFSSLMFYGSRTLPSTALIVLTLVLLLIYLLALNLAERWT